MTTTPDRSDLDRMRAEIEDIDRSLLDLFTRRMAVARGVAAFKATNNSPVFVPVREEEVVEKALKQVDKPDAVRAEILLRSLMRLSRSVQYDKLFKDGLHFDLEKQIRSAPQRIPEATRLVYQGSEGSYTELASNVMFRNVVGEAVLTWAEACRQVSSGEADIAVLPLENTTAGTVDEVHDLLIEHGLYILRSRTLPIQHCLLGQPDAKLDDVQTVISHPQALSQCSDMIRSKGWKTRQSANTSFAALEAASTRDPHTAAIGSELAASKAGLKVLSRQICNSHANQTRFIAVGRDLVITPDADRISLALQLPHRSGALVSTLSVFGDRGINLTKIESRPDLEHPWQYLFYLDFESSIQSPDAALATLLQLSSEMPRLHLLGWYHEE